MTTLNADLQKSLQKALYAYVHSYGGASTGAARAIAGALLAVKEKAGELVSKGWEIENWVNAIVSDFDVAKVAEQAWDMGEKAIATQAKNWRETLEVKIRAALDAYIQKYVPNLDSTKIRDIVTTVLPIVEDAKISRDEAKRLVNTVSQQFDWQSAIARVIDPQWVMWADKTMQVINNSDLEASATDVMNAYVQKFRPAAVEIGEDLVEQAIQAVTNSKVKLGLNVDLDPETQKLMVKQVMLKFNLREASPPPSKTALEMAQQMHDEVIRYRQERGLDDIDLTPEIVRTDTSTGDSVLGGEISVGFELKPGVNIAHSGRISQKLTELYKLKSVAAERLESPDLLYIRHDLRPSLR